MTPLAAHNGTGKIHAVDREGARAALCGVVLDFDSVRSAGSKPFANVGPDYVCKRCERVAARRSA